MKTIYGFALVFLALVLAHSTESFAQDDWISETTFSKHKEKKKTTMPALKVAFEAEPGDVEDFFGNRFKKDYKVKLKKGMIEGVIIESVSPDKLEVFLDISKGSDGGTVFHASASKGYDLVLSRERFADEFEKFKTFIKNMSVAFNKDYYNKKLEALQKNLTDLQGDKASAEKKIVSLNNKITSNEAEIEKLKQANIDNGNSIKENEATIESLKKSIEEAEKRVKEMMERIGKL